MGDKHKRKRKQAQAAGGAPLLALLDVVNRLGAVPAPADDRGKAGKPTRKRKKKSSGESPSVEFAGAGPANPLNVLGQLASGATVVNSLLNVPGRPLSDAPSPAAGSPIPVVNELVSRLGLPLGNTALGGLADTAITPVIDTVGHGLRQAGELANSPPLSEVTDLIARVINGGGPAEAAEALRHRGTALVRVSYKPELQRRDVHPSFSRIIDELVPDEARILRFLKVAGTQPMIDVRTKTWFQIGSELVISGVSMIARMAGCLWPDRDQHYFANLDRLGLVAISNEPVDDYRRYALLEVQQSAVEAIESVPKAVTIYRSVRLTAFGEQFVDVCIDCDGYTAGGWDTDGRQDKIKGKGPPATRDRGDGKALAQIR
ncbi:DUF4393 domain-containing protein [Mycobacterium sp. SVM_VP21]|nr:DUF4393 domain-containing protein [Mycobacterium sp. SVM_VP21]